jgi:hypothetical protein
MTTKVHSSTSCLHGLLQFRPGSLEVIGDEFGVGEHGHEVRIAVPSGYNVKMNVLVDASSGNPPQIRSEIETMRSAYLAEGLRRHRGCLHRFEVYSIREQFKFGSVFVRNDHQMTAVVGEQIHDDEAVLATPDNEVLFITAFFRDPAKETRLAF